MDYAQLVSTLQERLAPLARAEEEFEFQSEIYPGMTPAAIDAVEAAIAAEEGMAGFRVSAELRRFYAAANGLYIHWVDRHGRETIETSETSAVSYPIGGLAKIPYLPELYEPDEPDEPDEPRARAVYDRYKLFDRADSRDRVSLRFERGQPEPQLYFFERNTGVSYPLALDIPTYLELLLEARGLIWWQQFFVADPSFRMDPIKADIFQRALRRLFPDADAARFRR